MVIYSSTSIVAVLISHFLSLFESLHTLTAAYNVKIIFYYYTFVNLWYC